MNCVVALVVQGLCRQWYDQEMVDEVERVMAVYQEEGGTLELEVRTLILRHCDHCRDRDCRVPHTAAGW